MPLLDDVYRLYLLERQVRGLSGRLEAAQKQQAIHQTRRSRLQTQLREQHDQLRHVQTRATTLEHQARDLGQKIDHVRQQMNSVRNNREYSALLVEMNTFKVEKGKLEEEALEQMARVETLQAAVAELEGKIVEQEKLLSAAASDVGAREAEVSAELTARTAERDAARKQVPGDTLITFDRLVRQHDGEAMAAVIEDDPRNLEYTCGGCYMGIPIELVNALMTQRSDLCTCPSCGRILYLGDDLKDKMASRSKSRAAT